MYPGSGAYGRAYLTKEERKTLTRDEKKSLRSERKAQVKAQAPGSRRSFLQALKSAAGLQQQGFVANEQPVAADGSLVFDTGASTSLVPGVPNWALAATAVVLTAGTVGTVLYVRRAR
jgi:hypothetical protein